MRSGKKPQRKARNHCTEKELRSQMRDLVQDRDTNGTSTRAVNYTQEVTRIAFFVIISGHKPSFFYLKLFLL